MCFIEIYVYNFKRLLKYLSYDTSFTIMRLVCAYKNICWHQKLWPSIHYFASKLHAKILKCNKMLKFCQKCLKNMAYHFSLYISMQLKILDYSLFITAREKQNKT